MDPSWPQHLMKIPQTHSPLSREPIAVLSLTYAKNKANKVVGDDSESFVQNHSDTCFICFLLSLRLPKRISP